MDKGGEGGHGGWEGREPGCRLIWFQNRPRFIVCLASSIEKEEVKEGRKEGSKGPDSCRATRETDRPTDQPTSVPREKSGLRNTSIFFGPRTHCTEIREVGLPDQPVFLISVERVGNHIHYFRETLSPLRRRRTKGSSSSNQHPR